MLDIRESEILKTTISKIFPAIIIFSFFLFSYGPISPGGGFQAGVIFGTLIIIFEMCYEKKIMADTFYSAVEYSGVLIVLLTMLIGLKATGFLFGGFYYIHTGSRIFANFFLWILNLAIFLEVSSSIILIFRNFIEWREDE
jgi:multicomponent Na+:H+ antiporter subunit B